MIADHTTTDAPLHMNQLLCPQDGFFAAAPAAPRLLSSEKETKNRLKRERLSRARGVLACDLCSYALPQRPDWTRREAEKHAAATPTTRRRYAVASHGRRRDVNMLVHSFLKGGVR